MVREGKDVTVVAIGWMVQKALQAAASLSKAGIECEIIDPRTVSPMDYDTIIKSVEKTGRLVIVGESNPCCSMASDISAKIPQDAFKAVKGPIQMVTAPHTPSPFNGVLEDLYLPGPAKIEAAVKATM